MENNVYDIVIIGAGASGLMFASSFCLGEDPARPAMSGIILEGTQKAGSKLLMSGGGRCNITHGGSIKDFLNAYGAAGTLFRKTLYKHSNYELASWLDSKGMRLAGDNGRMLDLSGGARSLDGIGRIFPASLKAQDVLDLFLNEAHKNGWELHTNAKVYGLKRAEVCETKPEAGRNDNSDIDKDKRDDVWEILLEEGLLIYAHNVVIASGGITYPETGSDGSILDMLEGLGIGVSRPRPALAPVYIRDYPYAELSGITIPDVTVTAYSSDASCTCNGKAARMTGDLLFTHNGFSGPVILNISKYAESGERIRLIYNKELSGLPRRMQRVLEERAKGPSGDIRTTALAALLDHDDFVVDRVSDRGMVTAGGITLNEIDMSTMRIKSFDSGSGDMYVIGEAIDADGITGGYNLQLCWSTAATAASALEMSIDSCVF